jgi:hypothetical protein
VALCSGFRRAFFRRTIRKSIFQPIVMVLVEKG